MHGHDTIVLGGSAGALEALRQVVAALPAAIPAALFVAVHHLPYAPSYLPEVLSRWGPLTALHPADREEVRHGTIYVAPPDHHLLLAGGAVRVVKGPKEHNTRPAIDPLFRSAALTSGPRAVGIVLSGTLDDGSAGLATIHSRAGVAIAQEPADALYRDMPQNALNQVPAARCLPASRIGAEIARLAREPAGAAPGPPPSELEWEVAVAGWDLEALDGRRPGQPSPFSCPDCNGDLWEFGSAGLPRFRCRTGHAYSPRSLLACQSVGVDDALNEAFRALKEKEHSHRRMAALSGRIGGPERGAYHGEQADRAAAASAEVLRLMLGLRGGDGEAVKGA